VLLIGLLSMGPAAKACQSVFANQTGSLDDPDKKEERLTATLAAGVAPAALTTVSSRDSLLGQSLFSDRYRSSVHRG